MTFLPNFFRAEAHRINRVVGGQAERFVELARRTGLTVETREAGDLLATEWERKSDWHEQRGAYERAEQYARVATALRELVEG